MISFVFMIYDFILPGVVLFLGELMPDALQACIHTCLICRERHETRDEKREERGARVISII